MSTTSKEDLELAKLVSDNTVVDLSGDFSFLLEWVAENKLPVFSGYEKKIR